MDILEGRAMGTSDQLDVGVSRGVERGVGLKDGVSQGGAGALEQGPRSTSLGFITGTLLRGSCG